MAVSLSPLSIPGVCRKPREHHPGIRIIDSERYEANTDMKLLFAHSFGYKPAVYGNCVHTQYAALAERHIKDRSYIGFDPKIFRTLTRPLVRKFLKHVNLELVPYSAKAIVAGYTGGKRAVYERAALSINSKGFDKRWTHVKMFVKPDKIPMGEIYDKAPRAIQFRRPEYNLLMAQYLKPIENEVYKYKEFGLRVFAKGRNLQQRAADIIAAYNSIDNCVVVECDHSKFDSCVTVEHLKFLHKIYLKFFPSRWLYFLLKHQINNKGRSSYLKYTVKGTRMSGDFDTALGNTLLNYFVLKAAVERCGIQNYRLYIDGDDSLLFIPAQTDLSKLKFNDLGFETVWDVKDLVEAEFCKGHVIRSDPPILVRDPRRIVAHMQVCLRSYGPSTWPELLQGKLVCEFWANQGVPYIAKWVKTLLDPRIPYRIPVEDLRRWGMVKDNKVGYVTPQAYQDMITAYGFGAAEASLLFTPIASTFPNSVLQGKGSNKKYKKRRYVWTPESLRRIGATFPTLDCSPSLWCGTSCRCWLVESGQQCGDLPIPSH